MSPFARGLFRWLGRAVVAIVIAMVVCWFALPPAIDAKDGAADPILSVRRPFMKTLYRLGVPRSFIGPDDWIPSETSTESWSSDTKNSTFESATDSTQTTLQSEPVYRGALWRVGRRVTIVLNLKGPDADPPVALTLWSDGDAGQVEIAKGGAATVDAVTGVRRLEISGFVPSSARNFGWSRVSADGRVNEGSSWSD